MTNRHRGPMIESNVAKVCMSIEAAKVGLAKVPQNFAGTFDVAAVFPIVRLYDGVGKRILCIRSRQHLLHFKFRARSPRDDWFDPVFDRLTLLAPVMLGRVPRVPRFQFERSKAQRLRVKPRAFNFTRKIGIARVAPLLAWP